MVNQASHSSFFAVVDATAAHNSAREGQRGRLLTCRGRLDARRNKGNHREFKVPVKPGRVRRTGTWNAEQYWEATGFRK